MTALEKSIADLCRKHGVKSFDLTYFDATATGEPFYSVHLHSSPVNGHKIGATIAEALAGAITDLNAKRGLGFELADEPIAEAA